MNEIIITKENFDEEVRNYKECLFCSISGKAVRDQVHDARSGY